MAKNKNTWMESMFAGMTGLFTGFSQYLSGEAGAQDAQSRALTNTFNAQSSRLDTAEALKQKELDRRQAIGAGEVGRAKQGVATGGSASLVIDEADRNFTLDMLAIKHREELNQLETSLQNQALQDKAGTSRRLGRIGAFGSLLQASGHFAEAVRIGND